MKLSIDEAQKFLVKFFCNFLISNLKCQGQTVFVQNHLFDCQNLSVVRDVFNINMRTAWGASPVVETGAHWDKKHILMQISILK